VVEHDELAYRPAGISVAADSRSGTADIRRAVDETTALAMYGRHGPTRKERKLEKGVMNAVRLGAQV